MFSNMKKNTKNGVNKKNELPQLIARHIAITGGTGFIGSHVLEELSRLKATLTVLTRDPKNPFFKKLAFRKNLVIVHAGADGDIRSLTHPGVCG